MQMLESVEETFSTAFTKIKEWLTVTLDSNAVLVCHKTDMASFDLSSTQDDDYIMSKVVIILVSDEIQKSESFACDLLRKVESSLKPCGLLVILPSSRQTRTDCKSYLLVLCLLVSLCKETGSILRIFIKTGLQIGNVMRYMSQVPM